MRSTYFLMAQRAEIAPTGHPSIYGVFDSVIFGPAVGTGVIPPNAQLRVTWPKCVLVAGLECAPSEGADHAVAIRVLDEDEQRAAPDGPPIVRRFPANSAGRAMQSIELVEIEGLVVNCPGDYRFVLLVDGQPIAECPFFADRSAG